MVYLDFSAPKHIIYRLVTVSETELRRPNCFMHFFNRSFAVFTLFCVELQTDPVHKSFNKQQGNHLLQLKLRSVRISEYCAAFPVSATFINMKSLTDKADAATLIMSVKHGACLLQYL